MYCRTCQECGHTQPAKPPQEYTGATEAWRDTKCRKCKSQALDYGGDGYTLNPETKKYVRQDNETQEL